MTNISEENFPETFQTLHKFRFAKKPLFQSIISHMDIYL